MKRFLSGAALASALAAIPAVSVAAASTEVQLYVR